MIGSIQIITGPMFSGKSTELMRRLDIHKSSGKSIVGIKYSKDKRYSDYKICTHDRKCGDFETICIDEDIQNAPSLDQYDVIGIDEGQFFTNILSFANHYVEKGKVVIIATLNGTSEMEPFENISPLYAIADYIDKLWAICTICGDRAHFSKRLSDKNNVFLIGGQAEYNARCRLCFSQ